MALEPVNIKHVVPVLDILDHHTDGKACPCCPRLSAQTCDGSVLVIHNSFDFREYQRDHEGQVVQINPRMN